MMSLPFILSFCLISLNTFIDPNKMVLGWTISNKSLIFLTALVLGGLPFINIWDIVPFLLFWAALVCIKTYYEDSLVQFRTCRLPNVEVVKYMLSVMLLSFSKQVLLTEEIISSLQIIMTAGNKIKGSWVR